MTQIEIIDVSDGFITAAFYYSVPPALQLPGAVDPTRTPVGTRLSVQEKLDLQNGVLYEKVIRQDFKPTAALTEIAASLISARNALQAEAANEYALKYSLKPHIGKAYDGTTWS